MPITATAQGKKFTFPDGTPPEQMGSAIDEFFASQPAQEETEEQVVSPVARQPQGASPRNRRANKLRAEREETQSLLSQFEAGEITSQDLTDGEVERVRKARIDAIPEITGSFEKLSKNLGFTEALAGLTAFDPDEFGNILQAADPEIGVVTTPDGERIAINRKTNEAFSINKTGPSLMDAVQIGGAVSLFSPSGGAGGIVQGVGRQALAGAATQAAVETGQAIKGGEFDVAPVVAAGVAVPVVTVAGKAIKAGAAKVRDAARLAPKPVQAAKADSIPLAQRKSERIKKIIEEESDDEIVSKFDIVNGRSVDDRVGQFALKQGYQPGVVAAIKTANKETKAQVAKMVPIIKAGLSNAKNAARNRPSDVIGSSMLKRFNAVKTINKQAGKEVDEAGRALKGDKVNIDNVIDQFKDDLDDLGVVLDDSLNPTFLDLSIDKAADKSAVLRAIKNVKAVQGDAFKAHRAKRILDSDIDFGPGGAEGISGQVESAIKSLRGGINSELRTLSDDYAAANTKYSETIDSIKFFGDSVGEKNFRPLTDANAEKFLGKISRRILGNLQSRERLIQSLDDLESVGGKYGAKFLDDIDTQVQVVNDLESIFGSFAPQSFQGNMQKAIRVESADPRQLLKRVGLDKLGEVGTKALGINEKAALKALEELTKRAAK